MMCGGIDLGGTKIEARLFDGPDTRTLATHRVPTPNRSFDALLEALVDAVRWLQNQAGMQELPIGLSMAGLIHPTTGIAFCANIPASGHAVGAKLSKATGQTIPVLNDCMAFAFSEASGGAGEATRSVMGLVIGTGVGGGICMDGQLPHRHGGLPVEVGHLGLSTATLARHGLAPLPCGCGQIGCVETYVAGPGLSQLAHQRLGRALSPADIGKDPDARVHDVLDIWADLAADALYAIQIMLAPDRIVLGGGLSNLPDCAQRLTRALATRGLGEAPRPDIVTARFGDSSGARGAALIAKAQ